MSGEVVLKGDVRQAIYHLAGFGLAAIIESALECTARVGLSSEGVTVGWDGGHTTFDVGEAVAAHARQREGCWVDDVTELSGGIFGTLSPRIKTPQDDAWQQLQKARLAAVDEAYRRWPNGSLDLEFISALGEPAYWIHDFQGKVRPERGASMWEMKTRNRGEDFVANRLTSLRRAVAARTAEGVLRGLTGEVPVDETGSGTDSRTPTGLTAPRPTDSALAWCGLWGISLLPVTHDARPAGGRTRALGQDSITTGMIRLKLADPGPTGSRALVFLPLFARLTRLARIRTVAQSRALARYVAATVVEGATRGSVAGSDNDARDLASDAAWLRSKGCRGLLVAYQLASDNPNAPELHVTAGEVHPLGER